jgi:hypothetical protein
MFTNHPCLYIISRSSARRPCLPLTTVFVVAHHFQPRQDYCCVIHQRLQQSTCKEHHRPILYASFLRADEGVGSILRSFLPSMFLERETNAKTIGTERTLVSATIYLD